MFGISGSEFIVLVVVIIIFLGPKHAAQAVKAIRTAMGYIRDFSAQLRSQVSAQHAQSTLESLGITEEDLAALRKLRSTTGSLDPRAFVRQTVAEEMDAWLDMSPATRPTSTTNGFPKNAYKKTSTPSKNISKPVQSEAENTQGNNQSLHDTSQLSPEERKES